MRSTIPAVASCEPCPPSELVLGTRGAAAFGISCDTGWYFCNAASNTLGSRGEVLQNRQAIGESKYRHSLPGLVLIAHKLQHLLARISLVLERRIGRIQQQNHQRAAGRTVFGLIGIYPWRKSRRGLLLFFAGGTEKGDLLVLSLFLHREIFLLQALDRLALLVGHDHIDQHQMGADTNGRNGKLRTGRRSLKPTACRNHGRQNTSQGNPARE